MVEHVAVTEENILSVIEDFEHKIEHYDIPSDGLVLTYESISYGQSLGRTAKFPRDSIAFKWADELRETTLKEIEWSASRTGLINPVAIFEPVELEGTQSAVPRCIISAYYVPFDWGSEITLQSIRRI